MCTGTCIHPAWGVKMVRSSARNKQPEFYAVSRRNRCASRGELRAGWSTTPARPRLNFRRGDTKQAYQSYHFHARYPSSRGIAPVAPIFLFNLWPCPDVPYFYRLARSELHPSHTSRMPTMWLSDTQSKIRSPSVLELFFCMPSNMTDRDWGRLLLRR